MTMIYYGRKGYETVFLPFCVTLKIQVLGQKLIFPQFQCFKSFMKFIIYKL
ncbi:hypothetical protein C1645_795306, partial [Glomus cerebriforme]